MLPVPLRRDRFTTEVGPDDSGSKPGIEGCIHLPEISGMDAMLSLPLLAAPTVGARRRLADVVVCQRCLFARGRDLLHPPQKPLNATPINGPQVLEVGVRRTVSRPKVRPARDRMNSERDELAAARPHLDLARPQRGHLLARAIDEQPLRKLADAEKPRRSPRLSTGLSPC
jgi:hypothetical protein